MGALSSYCGLLTLQVGVAISAILFFSMSTVILAANIFNFNYSGGWHLNLMFMCIFAAVLLLLGGCLFAAAFKEDRKFAMVAAVGIAILAAYWVVLSCLSFFGESDHVRAVCIDSRCPESFWIANLDYRAKRNDSSDLSLKLSLAAENTHGIFPKGISSRLELAAAGTRPELSTGRHPALGAGVPEPPPGSSRELHASSGSSSGPHAGFPDLPPGSFERLPMGKRQAGKDPKHSSTTNSTDDTGAKPSKDPPESNDRDRSKYDEDQFLARQAATYPSTTTSSTTPSGATPKPSSSNGIQRPFPFSGAVILFFANLLFLVYTALLAWSYASELDWADYYVEDEVYYE